MKKLSIFALVALMAATTLFIFTPNSNNIASAVEIQNSISGTCYKNYPSTETLAGLKVTCTGGGNTYYTYTNEVGQYQFASLTADVTYELVAESPDYNANGGWRGTASVHTPSCENPPCNFNLTQNITCSYHDNPN
ncbi:MAG: carboxypeptidase-like regulatory domain-containing protein [Bacteroidota bacterium]